MEQNAEMRPGDGDLGEAEHRSSHLATAQPFGSKWERAHHRSVLVEKLPEVVTTFPAFKSTPQMTKTTLCSGFKGHGVQGKGLQPWQAGVHHIIS